VIINQRARPTMRAAATSDSTASSASATPGLRAAVSAWLGDLPAAKVPIEVPAESADDVDVEIHPHRRR
jgi:hypothetical protein